MHTPTLSHRAWEILSGLISAGGEMLFAELHAQTCPDTDKSNLCGLARKMEGEGFITRELIKRRDDPAPYWQSCIRITPVGREVWSETLDFYLCLAERCRARSQTAGVPSIEAVDRRPPKRVPARPGARNRSRGLSSADEQRLFAEASPRFISVYKAIRLIPAFLPEIAGLQIADVDLPGGRLTIRASSGADAGQRSPERILPLSRELRNILRGAIANRTAGPVFITRRGQPWNHANIGNEFRRVAKKAGLPGDLKFLQGRYLELCKSLGITPRVKHRNGWPASRR